MAIQFRASSVTGGLGSPASITKPTGTAEGDLLLLHVRTQSDVTPTAPSGFTLITNGSISGTSGIYVYSKVAGASEPANYTVTFASGTVRLGMMALYSDTGSTIELDASANQSNVSSSTYTAPSVTTTVANTLLTVFITVNLAGTITAGSGLTKRYDTGGTSSLFGATEAIAAAGATGTRTAAGGAATSRAVTAAWKELLAAAPTAPSGLTVTPISSSQLDLAWTDNSSNEDGFEIERSPDGSTGWTLIHTTAANAEAHSDTGLTEGTIFHYRVRAFNNGGDSAYSASISNSTYHELFAPSDLVANVLGPASIELTWEDTNEYEEGYEVQRSDNGVDGWTVIATLGIGETEYTDNDLEAEQTVFYRVRAYQE
jgi:hypothetical protein